LATILFASWALAGRASASTATVKLSSLSLVGVEQHNEMLGSPTAPVRMVYFDDTQCPFCEEWHRNVLPTLIKRYVRTGKLQIQWRGFPVVGPDSVKGERFVLAAGLQDHLWDVLDDVFANQGAENSGWLTPALLEQIGSSIPGFNVPRAMADTGSQAVSQEAHADSQLGRKRNLQGVPSFLLGRRGQALRLLTVNSLTPAEFTGPITRLLHRRGATRRLLT
jgi:protein-disulfide isomerase